MSIDQNFKALVIAQQRIASQNSFVDLIKTESTKLMRMSVYLIITHHYVVVGDRNAIFIIQGAILVNIILQ